MANKINVNAKASKVENAKTAKQKSDLEKAKERKKEADKNAETAKAKAKEAKAKEKENNKKEEDNTTIDASSLVAGIGSIATSVVNTKKSGGFLKGLILGVVLGVALTALLGTTLLKDSLFNKVETSKDKADELIDETFFGYTALDFKEAILGKAVEQQKLIVMEQPLEISTTITKAGLADLAIFSKTKNINYVGTGQYTVDLKDIDEDHINVDEENKVLTVIIPHAILNEVIIDYENIEFEDTDKGLLALGDLNLSSEDQNDVYIAVKNAMEERLSQKDIMDSADEYAVMKTWETFQPLISAMNPEYKVEIQFE